jgi:putative heme iron utilization protein
METQITLQLKKAIQEITGVDINEVTRKRETIEARAIYYKVLKQIDKKKSLKSIGASVGKDHATVLHSLRNYDMFEQFNPTLKLFRKQIMQRLNYATPDILDMTKDELIQSLQIDVMKLSGEIENLQETITNLQTPRNKYKIVNNIETLLLETEGKEQQEIIIERLQAVYRMNRNIKL